MNIVLDLWSVLEFSTWLVKKDAARVTAIARTRAMFPTYKALDTTSNFDILPLNECQRMQVGEVL